jgi:hypothetical protein
VKEGRMKALSITGLVTAFSFCMISIASAGNYIGIILEGYEKDCVVKSKGEHYDCKESRKLYEGDEVTKKPDIKTLKIKWAPYASGKELNATSLIVVFAPPQDKNGIVLALKEFLGLVKAEHITSVGVTRGSSARPMAPQPGANATVISGQKTTFAWENGGGAYIFFKDRRGTQVFRKQVQGKAHVQLAPEEIGMRPGEVYTWNVVGLRELGRFEVRLLDDETAQQVSSDLNRINEEQMSDAEKGIKKAAYLQFLSDSYSQEIDLYWLSYQILEGIKDESILSEDGKTLLEELRNRCLKHMEKMCER